MQPKREHPHGLQQQEAPGMRSAEVVPTHDMLLARIAQLVPAFAGIYRDPGTGRLIMAVTDLRQREETLSAMRAVFAGIRDLGELHAVQVNYGFLQLYGWSRQIMRLSPELPEMVSIDINERENRLVVGVLEEGHRGKLEAALALLGLPNGAVHIRIEDPIAPLYSLSDPHRPTVGGLRIHGGVGSGFCTLGWNVIYDGQRGLATNSHCQMAAGFYQGGSLGDPEQQYFVADNVILDSGWASQQHGCNLGQTCKLNDLRIVSYVSTASSTLGYVAQSCTDGSTSVCGESPIVDKYYYIFEGEVVYKTGARTGTTWGIVTNNCWNYFDNGVWWLCQGKVERSNISGQGDSGSAVYYKDYDGNLILAGQLHRGQSSFQSALSGWYMFSPYNNIVIEHGDIISTVWGS